MLFTFFSKAICKNCEFVNLLFHNSIPASWDDDTHNETFYIWYMYLSPRRTIVKWKKMNKNSPLFHDHMRVFHITILIVLWSWEEFLNILYYLTVKPYGCFILLSFKLTCYLPTVGSSVANHTTPLWPYAYSALYLNLR